MLLQSPVSYFIAIILLISTASIVCAQGPATEPSGTWRWNYEMDGKTREDSVMLHLDNGKLTGAFQGISEKPVDIKEAKFKDNHLSFAVEYKVKDQSVSLAFEGKAH